MTVSEWQERREEFPESYVTHKRGYVESLEAVARNQREEIEKLQTRANQRAKDKAAKDFEVMAATDQIRCALAYQKSAMERESKSRAKVLKLRDEIRKLKRMRHHMNPLRVISEWIHALKIRHLRASKRKAKRD